MGRSKPRSVLTQQIVRTAREAEYAAVLRTANLLLMVDVVLLAFAIRSEQNYHRSASLSGSFDRSNQNAGRFVDQIESPTFNRLRVFLLYSNSIIANHRVWRTCGLVITSGAQDLQ